MIVFAGWGILALVPPAIGWFLGFLVGGAVGGESSTVAMAITGLGLMLGSAGDWYLGLYFNKTMARRNIDKALAARQTQLQQLVASGQYYRGPGYPMPTSLQDAQNQAQAQFQAESAAAYAHIGNRNTLFFIPIQYWAFIGAAIGAIMVVYYLFF